MTSTSFKNPDSRIIPEGWAEHYDTARQIWYYIDLNVENPRVTFAHPCDLDRQQPSSAPARIREHPNPGRNAASLQRPVGPRKNSTASINAVIRETQRSRRATVAQQLYASALPAPSLTSSRSGSSSTKSTSTSSSTESSPRSSVSKAATDSDEVATKTVVVSTTSPSSLTPHLDTHHPRNVFDCTRLAPGTRRKTINGARPSPTPTHGLLSSDPNPRPDGSVLVNAQAFYHPSVSIKASTSPVPLAVKAFPENSVVRSVKVPLPPIPTVPTKSTGSSSLPLLSTSAKSLQFSGTTEDNLLVMPIASPRSPLSSSPIPLDVSAIQNVQMLPTNAPRPVRSASPSMNATILQPKPIRPMNGITLNLQVQVAEMPEPPLTQNDGNKSARRKSQLLKNFTLRKGNSKGKQKAIEPDESENFTPGADAFPCSLDGSFVVIDSQGRN